MVRYDIDVKWGDDGRFINEYVVKQKIVCFFQCYTVSAYYWGYYGYPYVLWWDYPNTMDIILWDNPWVLG